VLAELDSLLDRMLGAILGPFLEPTHRLLSECLDHDYGRPEDANADLCYLGHAIETLWMIMSEAERRGDEALYARAAALFRRHVECAWDPACGGLFRGVHTRSWSYLLDRDAKVKWAHDEACVGCMMLVAHPPSPDLLEPGEGEATAVWAARAVRRIRGYVERAFRLGPGSWKVGGDRWAKPDVDPATQLSGYNMGCASLPNRVEHYHTPRALASCIRSCDAAIARLGAASDRGDSEAAP
jgi:mannose/cellobiose epimerase-like protein (N-acyl-D-glucosamine 2-epimerase family)